MLTQNRMWIYVRIYRYPICHYFSQGLRIRNSFICAFRMISFLNLKSRFPYRLLAGSPQDLAVPLWSSPMARMAISRVSITVTILSTLPLPLVCQTSQPILTQRSARHGTTKATKCSWPPENRKLKTEK